ncbi:4a-hydroxytetrahydrobiopterin dehydratase [Hyphomonas johnsonii]|jgi:4a-hydroxytetrahydrobiopterin dehydratase|uniref:Putative pterin-4-alpha-carbinolamine dehydratase n=1 Tax=Hyphomonas johnsonii MHS-2 TaxID=1280950 RepID=A0A059FPR4_9PROT|nr:4a-hydroxytetrahydrobiopterin dehydratase [Hyphomonas johnsonii]KCZ92670.1 pterin-4-alpha-carbinolamine dehydratase [Hyphomonas johnsonii MHS-2]
MAGKIGAGAALARLDDWRAGDGERDTICKTYKFADFKTAWAFMSGCALKAEAMDHHPEWFNVYNRVEVTLTTHDVDGVSDKDVTLGVFMDTLAAKLA